MSKPIQDAARPDQEALLQEVAKGMLGSTQSTYVTGSVPIEPNRAFTNLDTNIVMPQAVNNEAGLYEAKEIDIPAVPQLEPANTPPVGSKRWNEIYHKAKKADKLEQELNGLKQTVEMLKGNMGTVAVSNVTSELSNLQKAHQEALEAGDYSKASKLNTEMMNLTVKKQQLEANFNSSIYAPTPAPEAMAPIAENIQQQYNQPTPPIEAIVAAQTFEQNNPWYVTDPALNAAFNALHQQTMQDWQWAEKPIAAQLNESLRQFKSRFPHMFRQAAPPAAVAGVTPSAPPQQPQQVTLTDQERQVAMMFAPPGTDPAKAEAEFLKNKMYYVQQGVSF